MSKAKDDVTDLIISNIRKSALERGSATSLDSAVGQDARLPQRVLDMMRALKDKENVTGDMLDNMLDLVLMDNLGFLVEIMRGSDPEQAVKAFEAAAKIRGKQGKSGNINIKGGKGPMRMLVQFEGEEK